MYQIRIIRFTKNVFFIKYSFYIIYIVIFSIKLVKFRKI